MKKLFCTISIFTLISLNIHCAESDDKSKTIFGCLYNTARTTQVLSFGLGCLSAVASIGTIISVDNNPESSRKDLQEVAYNYAVFSVKSFLFCAGSTWAKNTLSNTKKLLIPGCDRKYK